MWILQFYKARTLEKPAYTSAFAKHTLVAERSRASGSFRSARILAVRWKQKRQDQFLVSHAVSLRASCATDRDPHKRDLEGRLSDLDRLLGQAFLAVKRLFDAAAV